MTDPSLAERVVAPSVAPHQSLSITKHTVLQSHSVSRHSGKPCTLISRQQMKEPAVLVSGSKGQLQLPPHQPLVNMQGHSDHFFSPEEKCQQPSAENSHNQLPNMKAAGSATLAEKPTDRKQATSAGASNKNPVRNQDAWTACRFQKTGSTDGGMGGNHDLDLAICSADHATNLGYLGHPVQQPSLSGQCDAQNYTLSAEHGHGVPTFLASCPSRPGTSSQPLVLNPATAAVLPDHKLPHQAPPLLGVYCQGFAQLFMQDFSHVKQQGLGPVLSIAVVTGACICSFVLMGQKGVLNSFSPLGLEWISTRHMVAKMQHLPATVRWCGNSWLGTLNALTRTVFVCSDIWLVWLRCCALLVSWYGPLVCRCSSRAAQLRRGWANRQASGLSRIALGASFVAGVVAVLGTLMR